MEPSSPAACRRCPNAQDVNCDPWSECVIVELLGVGRRRVMAIPRASVTSAVRMLSSIDHPMILLE
jgi:hypothetical protein